MRASSLPLALILVMACNDATVVDEGGTETETETETDSSGETSSDSGSDSTESSSSETETGEPGPYCGDGTVDPGEECDDSNVVDRDGCSARCESDCGIQYWVDLTVPAGWFAVHAMEARPGGRLTLAGDIAVDGEPGRLRVVTLLDSELEGSLESEPLGPVGTPELPETHQPHAIALTAANDVVALGTSTAVLVPDGDPVTSYWLARFAADGLAEQWRVDIPAAQPDLRPLDLGLLANGDAIITMTTQIADDDRDLAFERRSAIDGSVVWTSSLSGEFEGGWSLDAARQVAVGPDDRVWAMGILRVDWQTFETTIVELHPETGAVVWTMVPLADPGNGHEQVPYELSAGPNGRVAIGINVLGPASPYNFSAAFMYTDHELAWKLYPEDLPWRDGAPYLAPRIAIDADGDAMVAGTYTHDFVSSTAARTWVIGLDPAGAHLCAARVGQGQDAAIVPRAGFFDGGRGALNLDTYGLGGMGPGSDGNWLAGLRGW